MKCIWIVVPCYNEQEVLNETYAQLGTVMRTLISEGKIQRNSRIAFVDDGSVDRTWQMIEKFSAEDEMVVGIKLSRNCGHQNALYAGMMTAKKHADAVITIDADLQDDIQAVEKMIMQYTNGSDIVYGVRASRDTDSFFKRRSAECYYKLMNALGAELVFNHADFRLMSKRSIEALAQFGEVNLFLRGIVPRIGFPSSVVEYRRLERAAGETKYPLKRMLSLALDGLASFTIRPLRIALFVGTISFFVCIFMLLYCISSKISGNVVPGWASIGVSIWALGGVQSLLLGILGEYTGKIYLETKQRPKYIIETEIIHSSDTEC